MSTTDIDDSITETFNVILQKGLEGGSPPPTPHARYIITRAPRSGNFMMSTKIRPEGTPDLLPVVNRTLKVADHIKSIARFQKLMSEIPTQYCGAEDLYGRDTSVVQVTDPKALMDLHLYGSRTPNEPLATEEERVKFDEVLAIIENWVRPQGPLPMY